MLFFSLKKGLAIKIRMLCFVIINSVLFNLSCVLSLVGAATSITFVATITSFVATKVCLPQLNICRDKIVFVATKLLSCLSRQKTRFVATKDSFCRDKICLSQKVFSRLKYACRKKSFVATSILLSQQKILVAAPANASVWLSSNVNAKMVTAEVGAVGAKTLKRRLRPLWIYLP